MQWIPAQIGGIGEDSQVDSGKAKTTLYKVFRQQGYDRKDDTELPTCDDKGVFTDADDMLGERARRMWL